MICPSLTQLEFWLMHRSYLTVAETTRLLRVNPQRAGTGLGRGGFVRSALVLAGVGSLRLTSMRSCTVEHPRVICRITGRVGGCSTMSSAPLAGAWRCE